MASAPAAAAAAADDDDADDDDDDDDDDAATRRRRRLLLVVKWKLPEPTVNATVVSFVSACPLEIPTTPGINLPSFHTTVLPTPWSKSVSPCVLYTRIVW